MLNTSLDKSMLDKVDRNERFSSKTRDDDMEVEMEGDVKVKGAKRRVRVLDFIKSLKTKPQMSNEFR